MAHRSASSRGRAREQSAKVGGEVRLARVTLGLTRQHVANRAGVSWATELRVELGDPHLGVETMCAMAEAVGLDVVLRTYPGNQPGLRDTGQMRLAAQLVTQANAAWQPQIEVPVGQHGESIDLCFFGAGEIIDAEVERMAADFQNQYRRADRKRQALAAQHQRPVRLVLVLRTHVGTVRPLNRT